MNARLSLLVVALLTSLPAAAQYSLPFQLRPVPVGNAVRSDTAVAMIAPASGGTGSTLATTLLVSYKVMDDLAPFLRLAFVGNDPVTGQNGAALVNPILGAAYSLKLGEGLRGNGALGVAFPVLMGGGDSAPPEESAAAKAGVLARSAMDNALFAANDLVVFGGAGVAWTGGPFTAQVEATVLQLTRVRGENVQADTAKTNFTSGLHAGYFVIPELSLGLELRYQRWLSTPVAVTANERLRDNFTAAAGARAHLKLAEKVWFRPALVYVQPLDNPMSAQGYHIVQVDLPVSF